MVAVRQIVLVTATLLLPGMASGQTIRGVLVDRSENPVAGAVLLLLDSASRVTARALSDERGEYQLTARSTGVYRVRAMRIGFRPLTSDPLTLRSGEAVAQRLVLAGLPVSLDTVRVVGRNACQVRPDTAAATVAVWEQVRTALTAAELTARSRTIGATIVRYERFLHPNDGRVLRQSASISAGLTAQPWKSLSADSLRRAGYVATEADASTIYYAPDLAVLLSDAFLEDHCFRIAAESDESRIGIAFQPTRDRRRVPEIRGTLWLDRKSSELQRMEFRYANLSREQEAGDAGGELDFARMSNGAWVISRWKIRMPVLEARYVATGGLRLSRATRLETYVSEIRVEAGEVALVTIGRDTVWSQPPLALAGTVLDSASKRGVAAARVTLAGTALHTMTDSAGRFRLPHVLPGRYTLEIRTPSLDSLGATHAVPLTFAETTATLTVRVPTAKQVVAYLCPRVAAGSATGGAVVAGSVRTRADSTPSPDARVTAEWTEHSPLHGAASPARRRARWVEARTDSRGSFALCGLPVETAVVVSATADSSSARPLQLRIPSGRRFVRVDLTLDEPTAHHAILSGRVLTDSTHRPIADAEVALPELSRSVLTDERGAFRLPGIPPGTHLVTVRRLGFGPLNTRIAFGAQQMVDRQILLSRVAILDSVVVTASAVLPDFEENRRAGLGHFITRAELEKQRGRTVSAILAQTPGISIVPGMANHAWIASSRGQRSLSPPSCALDLVDARQGAKPCACYAQVYLDGVLVYSGRPREPLFDINRISPAEIEAIEYYASPARTPLKYSRLDSACGVVVIHTRRSP